MGPRRRSLDGARELVASRVAERGGSPHAGKGRTNSEGSLAGQEVPNSEATIVEAREVSNVLTAVARMDMEDRFDSLSQDRQSVQGRTRKCQQRLGLEYQCVSSRRKEVQQIRQL
jgi:hypothetical protein